MHTHKHKQGRHTYITPKTWQKKDSNIHIRTHKYTYKDLAINPTTTTMIDIKTHKAPQKENNKSNKDKL
jgi:hypothetical protein